MCKCVNPTGWGYTCDGDWCVDFLEGWHDENNCRGVIRELTNAGEPVDLVHDSI